MNNRRLALLVSLCAVLFGFAVAQKPVLTNAKVLLTETPTPSDIPVATSSTLVPSPANTPVVTPSIVCPTYYPLNADTQAHIPNLTPTSTPVPTPVVDPCYVHPTLILSGPSQVTVGELFTLSIAYENIGMQETTITFNDPNLAQFDPPLTMPCRYDQNPTRCTSIKVRATSVGTLVIDASARGESFNYGWYWSTAGARTPLTINVVDSNATTVPTPTCILPTLTPTSAVPPTNTPTATLVGQRVPNLTQTPAPSYTPTTTAVPCQLGPAAVLLLSAPPLVNVGDAFSLTIDYQNIGAPQTGITLSPNDLAQFDPPLAMPCRYFQHPTQCTTISLRATAPGVLTITAGASGEVRVGDRWMWGYASSRNPITVQVRDNLPNKLFIPFALTQ